MANRKTVDARTHAETLETLREVRFKLACMSEMLQYARLRLHPETRDFIDSGCLRLLMHTRGEEPLQFWFADKKITADGQTIRREIIKP
jgi:hypothetical protein